MKSINSKTASKTTKAATTTNKSVGAKTTSKMKAAKTTAFNPAPGRNDVPSSKTMNKAKASTTKATVTQSAKKSDSNYKVSTSKAKTATNSIGDKTTKAKATTSKAKTVSNNIGDKTAKAKSTTSKAKVSTPSGCRSVKSTGTLNAGKSAKTTAKTSSVHNKAEAKLGKLPEKQGAKASSAKPAKAKTTNASHTCNCVTKKSKSTSACAR